MRSEEEVAADEKNIPKSASGQKKHARKHHGVYSSRILRFPRTHIIPCFLHCLSAIVRKLFKLLLRDAHLAPEVSEEWIKLCACLKIKLAPPAEGKSFADRVRDARWGRPEWLAVLQHHKQFLQVMKDKIKYVPLWSSIYKTDLT